LLSGAALGLDYLHSQIVPAIIHGDIKPANIFVTEAYDAKIGDFGISKFKVEKVAGVLVQGTRAYMDVNSIMTGTGHHQVRCVQLRHRAAAAGH